MELTLGKWAWEVGFLFLSKKHHLRSDWGS